MSIECKVTKTKNPSVSGEEWLLKVEVVETRKDESEYIIRKWSVILPEEPTIT